MRSEKPFDAAIIGAGPAGATAARKLAESGARVGLFDNSHPREKPCGGGISARARTLFPELESLVSLGKTGTSLRLVSPSGRVLSVAGNQRTFAVDRQILDSHLLRSAVDAGVVHNETRVIDLRKLKDGWNVCCGKESFEARILIGADGVFSLARRKYIGNHAQEHTALGAHVIVENLDPPSALIKFFGDRRGFAWVFNRKERSSVGVGMPLVNCTGWREMLIRFFREQAGDREMPPVRSWCLPQASSADAFKKRLAGDDWCFIGDAAGHVDPLTGEGILYAMWGGALAAEAIISGHPEKYDAIWREAFLSRFLKHIRLSHLLPHPKAMEALLATGSLPFIGRKLFGALTSEH